MNRRKFSGLVAIGAASAVGTAGTGLPGLANAQGIPVEGTHYVRLSQPQQVSSGNKIEVIEFFWYGCPHCNAFEPALDAWQSKLPADVAFRRVPVAFQEEPYVAHQKIFYALEAIGQREALHRKVFYAIHAERQRLSKPAEIQAFVVKNGVDGAKFMDAFNSFSVQAKVKQASQLAAGYKIDGVPTIGVHGRYFTAGSLAGSNEAALAVADFLIQRVRKSA
jgi:thiol:disulfide interchange protein DsbA